MPARTNVAFAKQVRVPEDRGAHRGGGCARGSSAAELKPGMRLPTESELMVQFGVSRPTLREAFRILEAESLINVRRGVGGGALVTTPDIAIGARYVGLLLQLDGATIADVYEARTALEPICAGLMATRRQPADITALQRVIDRAAEPIDADPNGIPDPQAWPATTYEFHDLVPKGSGNKTMALQGALLQEVVAMHYAATIGDRRANNSSPQRFTGCWRPSQARQAHRRRRHDGAREHWLRHMQTAAKTLLGDDLKNKQLVDLFK